METLRGIEEALGGTAHLVVVEGMAAQRAGVVALQQTEAWQLAAGTLCDALSQLLGRTQLCCRTHLLRPCTVPPSNFMSLQYSTRMNEHCATQSAMLPTTTYQGASNASTI